VTRNRRAALNVVLPVIINFTTLISYACVDCRSGVCFPWESKNSFSSCDVALHGIKRAPAESFTSSTYGGFTFQHLYSIEKAAAVFECPGLNPSSLFNPTNCLNNTVLIPSLFRFPADARFFFLKIQTFKQNIGALVSSLIVSTLLSSSYHGRRQNKNLAIANRSRVSCINTNNNTMTLKSGLEVTQGH